MRNKNPQCSKNSINIICSTCWALCENQAPSNLWIVTKWAGPKTKPPYHLTRPTLSFQKSHITQSLIKPGILSHRLFSIKSQVNELNEWLTGWLTDTSVWLAVFSCRFYALLVNINPELLPLHICMCIYIYIFNTWLPRLTPNKKHSAPRRSQSHCIRYWQAINTNRSNQPAAEGFSSLLESFVATEMATATANLGSGLKIPEWQTDSRGRNARLGDSCCPWTVYTARPDPQSPRSNKSA